MFSVNSIGKNTGRLEKQPVDKTSRGQSWKNKSGPKLEKQVGAKAGKTDWGKKLEKQVGARLFLAIPSRELMYGWPRQSAEFAKLAFNATLIVPGHPESPAIPTHNAETRFLFTCDLPSWHEQIRWRMYLQAQGAVKSHLSQKLKTAPRHGELRGLILSRSRGTHNDKGDAGFSQKMESS